jgi:hypothetical protein
VGTEAVALVANAEIAKKVRRGAKDGKCFMGGACLISIYSGWLENYPGNRRYSPASMRRGLKKVGAEREMSFKSG